MLNAFAANSELPNSAAEPLWLAAGILDVFIDTAVDTFDTKIYAGTREFETMALDDPAWTPFLGTLMKAMPLRQSIAASDSFGFGRISRTIGELQLINSEGEYDDIVLRHTPAGRRVVLKAAQMQSDGEAPPYRDFVTVATLIAERWTLTREAVQIIFRDDMRLLEAPAQVNIYSGEGDLDGGLDVAGKRKPWALGIVKNATPAPVIPGENVYQISYRAVQGIDAVYDGGYGLTAAGNFATSTLLRAATVTPGAYATCVAEGLIKLGAPADKQVTVDVRGDNGGPGGYATTTADIVRTIITVAGVVDWTVGFDTTSIGLLNTVQPAPVGYFFAAGGSETVAQAIARLMGGIGGWVAFDRFGVVTMDRFEAPGTAPSAAYEESHMVTFDRDDTVGDTIPPPSRFRCAYNRNWTEQTDLVAIVGATDPARVAYLAQPYQVATTSDEEAAVVLNDYPNAPLPEVVDSFFASLADAQAEADRLLALYDGSRAPYRFRVKDRVYAHKPGETLLVSYPRFGLTDGRYMRIVEVNDDPEVNDTEIVVYG